MKKIPKPRTNPASCRHHVSSQPFSRFTTDGVSELVALADGLADNAGRQWSWLTIWRHSNGEALGRYELHSSYNSNTCTDHHAPLPPSYLLLNDRIYHISARLCGIIRPPLLKSNTTELFVPEYRRARTQIRGALVSASQLSGIIAVSRDTVSLTDGNVHIQFITESPGGDGVVFSADGK